MEGSSSLPIKSPSPTEIKKNIYHSLQLVSELRNLCQSALAKYSSLSSEEKDEIQRKCMELQKQVDENVKSFNTPSKKIEIVHKLLKADRKKKWKIRRRRLQRVRNSFYRSMVQERNKQIDLWRKEREKEMDKEVEEEKMQQEITKQEIQVKELSKQKYDLQKLLCSIQLLYEKRLHKLEKQGYHSRYHSTPEEEGLVQRARQEVEQYKEVVISERKKKEINNKIQQNENKEESDDEYYNGANHNISKLIAIRRAWDTYLVPSGHGSRIPTHFVDPPTRPWY